MKTTRRERREQRTAAYWGERRRSARDVAELAAVEWDSARARIRRLPPSDQDAAWRRLAEWLSAFEPEGERK